VIEFYDVQTIQNVSQLKTHLFLLRGSWITC